MRNTITRKEFNAIRDCTPEGLKGKQITETFDYKHIEHIGSYWKSGANWCYQIYVVLYEDRLYKVVTTFGEII